MGACGGGRGLGWSLRALAHPVRARGGIDRRPTIAGNAYCAEEEGVVVENGFVLAARLCHWLDGKTK